MIGVTCCRKGLNWVSTGGRSVSRTAAAPAAPPGALGELAEADEEALQVRGDPAVWRRTPLSSCAEGRSWVISGLVSGEKSSSLVERQP